MENQKVLDLIEKNISLPSVPMVANKVLSITRNPNGTVSELEKVITTDTNMSARVLRMANSAYYRRYDRVKSIKAAIGLMGFKALANLVLGVSTKAFYSPFGLVEKMLWEHSVGVAVASAAVAKRFKLMQSDEALSAGLMHDIGKTIINLANPDEYRKVIEEVYNTGCDYVESEQRILEFTHTDVGSVLVSKWNFPIEFGKAVHFHHRIEEIDPGSMDPIHIKFVGTVDIANKVARRLGIGYRNPDEGLDLTALESFKLLNIEVGEEDIDHLLEEVKTSFEEEASQFD